MDPYHENRLEDALDILEEQMASRRLPWKPLPRLTPIPPLMSAEELAMRLGHDARWLERRGREQEAADVRRFVERRRKTR